MVAGGATGAVGAPGEAGAAEVVGGCSATCGLPGWVRTRPPRARAMVTTAKRTGRNSAKAKLLTPFGRPDGEGKSVMTVDLYGPGGRRTSAWVGHLFEGFCPQTVGYCRRYILMPESRSGHNNTIGSTAFLKRANYP